MSQKQWGNVTWILFHSLAEKINENRFSNVKNIFIDFIKDTCKNLPCPICSEHAVRALREVNFQLINSKADMIEFLRQFHNIVNIRIDNPIMSKEFVIETYKLAQLHIIINNFYKIYSHKYGNFQINSFNRANQRILFLRDAQIKLNILLKECF